MKSKVENNFDGSENKPKVFCNNTEKTVEKTTRRGVFWTKFEFFSKFSQALF